MGRKADNKRYVIQRTLLILLMGAKCKFCPERRPERLQFHHKYRPKWRPQKTARHMRIRLYARDWGAGECVLACGRCNKKLGQPPLRPGEVEEPLPL